MAAPATSTVQTTPASHFLFRLMTLMNFSSCPSAGIIAICVNPSVSELYAGMH